MAKSTAQSATGEGKFYARWGPKGFYWSHDKAVPFWGLKTAHEIKKAYLDKSSKEPKNIVKRNATKITFNTRYVKAAGVDPKDQMRQWYELVGEKHPFFVGGQQFGPPLLQLEDVSWSNFMYAPDGTIIAADAEIHLIEWYKGIEIDQGWFNPEPEKKESASSGDIFSSGASNEIIIWNFCISQGFSIAATAGIMGNMYAESWLNPNQWEVATGWYGKGYGLCQWTNTGSGTAARLDRLIAWCKNNRYDHKTLEGQLNFMMYEYEMPYYKNLLGDRFKKVTDVYTATYQFLNWFEGHDSPLQEQNWPTRIQYANIYYSKYSKYGGLIPIPGQSTGSGSSGDGIFKQGWAWPLSIAYPSQTRPAGSDTNSAADYSVPTGTKVFACNGGTVDWVQYWDGRPAGAYYIMDNSTYGNCIRINHGNGWKTLYAHLSKINVTTGQKVSKGQLIGLSGNTGRSFGPHLHLEMTRNGAGVWPPSVLGH